MRQVSVRRRSSPVNARPALGGPALLLFAVFAAFAVATPVAGQVESSSAAEAIPTDLVVRVVANDAKIIGSGVGGAHVVVTHAETGEVLAQGMQKGGTGDTGLIMGDRVRGATLFDTEGAAAFRATLPISAPTPVRISARGPLAAAAATQEASITITMFPGEHLDGEGVLLNLNGFMVELLGPDTQPFEVPAGASYPVRAKVRMLCGCPTEPGGRWDADRITIRAHWVRDGMVMESSDLMFSGTTSEYTGSLKAPADAGPVTLRITAVDRGRANTGMVEALGMVR